MRKVASKYQPAGQVRFKGREHNSFLFENDFACITLTYYRADVVRVQIRRQDQESEPFSYAVIASPEKLDISIEETPEGFRIGGGGIVSVFLDNSNSAISFSDGDGTVLSEDDPLTTGWQGERVTTYRKLQEGERFIGMGEKTGHLDRRGSAYTHWNTDDFAYEHDADPLYLSTPFFIGIHSGKSYGIFLDNSHRSEVNFGASSDRFSWFSADYGEMDYYFFGGDVPRILENYSWLTGRLPMPPKWSLGYQQCRYSYYPDSEVLSVARNFRDKKIPADVVYLDIHYMDGYRVFTFHPDRFSDPKGLLDELKEMGFHVVVIVDPGIKKDPNYASYQSGLAGDHFVKLPDGDVYHGQVWPGWSAFPDFTSEATREWWADQFNAYTDVGIDGFWNDMNEPAAWGQSLPNNLEFKWEGEEASFLQARNTYGMHMARATREGAEKYLEKRPFILGRAGFSGIQRYAAIWTGDNVATDKHMMAGIRLVTSLGLAGIAYSGYDVGGFAGEASPHLYTRWIQIGAFSPFFRGHSVVNSRDSEPWSYGEQSEEINRNYIGLRYRLMPYIFSGMYEAHTIGMPLVRSLAIEHHQSDEIYDRAFENQYYFGPSLLVAPVDSTVSLAKVYLPEGNWYDLLTGKSYDGGQVIIEETPIEKLPVYVRGGTLLTMQSLVQSIAEAPEDTLFLHAYAGGSQPFSFTFYDDQDQPDPDSDGGFTRHQLEFDGQGRTLNIGANEGQWAGLFSKVRLYLHGFGEVGEVTVNGNAASTQTGDFHWVEPITQFDPMGPPTSELYGYEGVPYVEFDLQAADIRW